MTGVQHVVVMGVSGSGKSTVARLVAERLGWPFTEADELHPAANVAKMAAGIPLTDLDRGPWLALLRDGLTADARAGRSTVSTCSALKVAYRDVLREAEGRVRFVHLVADPAVLLARVEQRTHHFMPATLLRSQLDILEPLTAAEDGITVPTGDVPTLVADAVIRDLGLTALACP